ncbi:tRNA preQ1(34) S-adenosylmethionine ribosyltransferase-isomerase QueA [Nitrosomonas marina]|uniref:S-adenosylmethionine:tRNA ribosyltransferase-isomerase n=1 Tax=Nitrosomonas marina TaxID=917 RepID=A0A1H8GLU2_9PROT|nr:tRNA preQ1(34) S-adenosylmethionine ribosyltransferase-isomerase QueA [Nitrosomonas marina]SEN44457.1 S-adenosylmethionine:tRNA ribosyltransferase-isomerase [Nitrosomonas marina]
MNIREFDFDLPPELIAQHPAQQRASSRLLHLDSTSGQIRDLQFSCLPEYLRSGDVAVFNDTRVIKARLFGRKSSGGKIEILVERVLDEHHVQAAIRASHAPRPNSQLFLADEIPVTVLDRENAFYTLRFDHPQSIYELLERFGQLPLPPYISRSASSADESRYQTVYAKNAGAVAAPTAGLHFDENILNLLRAKGVMITYVTLHVGAGTFQPVRVETITDHTMHSELFHIPQQTADAIGHAKKNGGRILAVGTTSLRALEASAAQYHGQVTAGSGETDIFITPGYRFQVADRLLTNFHLPRSTLIMLVSAFGGMSNIRNAYQHAIKQQYRFFSYGDAMLIERKP